MALSEYPLLIAVELLIMRLCMEPKITNFYLDWTIQLSQDFHILTPHSSAKLVDHLGMRLGQIDVFHLSQKILSRMGDFL